VGYRSASGGSCVFQEREHIGQGIGGTCIIGRRRTKRRSRATAEAPQRSNPAFEAVRKFKKRRLSGARAQPASPESMDIGL